MFTVTLLSFGMEQVVVRRIAASGRSNWAATAYLFHSFFGSVICLLVVYLLSLFSDNHSLYYYLPLFFGAQAMIYISSPLKQFLNARERFAPYGVIALISNLGKVVMLLIFHRQGEISIRSVGLVLLISGSFELCCLLLYCYVNKDLRLPYRFKFSAYKMLVRESLPQFLSVIFDSSLSRIDWILLGVLSTATNIAEYSFAYRAYEVAKLPLVVLSPIVLVRYSKILSNNGLSEENRSDTIRLLYITAFFAVLVILVADVMWNPVIGAVTHGKYGGSNAGVFMILSMCLPLHFIINILWSISFASRKYRQITKFTIVIALVNLVLNLILIPIWGGMGAAVAYLVATLVQAVAYHRLVSTTFIKFSILHMLLIPVFGVASLCCSMFIFDNLYMQLVVALGIFVTLSAVFKMVRLSDITILKTYLRR